MASLRQLHKCRRNAAATAAFLLTLLSVAVARDHRPGVGRSSEAELRAPAPAPAQAGRSCEAQLRALPDHAARCRYLSWASHPACAPRGYVHYLRLFYCAFGGAPWLGAAALALWLLLLFYLLGDTASQYFCAALQGLSAALRLPPAIAGVTLLSLGNGAPDVLSSVVAFAAADADAGDVGLSSVLGGALFVSTVVAGVVAIVASSSGTRGGPVEIERAGFVRDVCFLLVALCYLLAVLLTGSVTVWAAASFLSLYAAYVLLVWTSHCCAEDGTTKPAVDDVAAAGPDPDLAAPLLAEDPDEPRAPRPPRAAVAAVPAASPHDPGHRGAPVVQALRGGVRAPRPSPPGGDLVPLQPRRRPLRRGGRDGPRGGGRPRHVLLVPARGPLPAPPVARRRVPHVRALVLLAGAGAGGAAGLHRPDCRREGERAGRDRAGVGQLAGGPGGRRGHGHARRPRRGPDRGVGLLRGPRIQHGRGPGPVADAGGRGPVPAPVRDPGGRVGVPGGRIPCGRAGVGDRGAARARHAAGQGAWGGAAPHLPRLPRS
ncbi:K-exchanger-like protein [Zea mays]|uniref:K-exchanger-like protein n=1 Tax=Zea mays TaxID=4577 RepID=A0A1D6KGN1_MAIZE|nr:K-exchanger-like protein [Zea mays]